MQTNSTAAPDLLTVGTAAGCGFASEILRDQLEVPERRLTFRTGRLERSFEAVADVIVNQCLLGALDGALHGLKLLGDLSAGPPLLDHGDDRFEVTIGALEASRNRRMRMVCHLESSILPGGYQRSPMEDTDKHLTRVWGGRIGRSLQGTGRFRKFNPNNEHSRTAHGQYHLWQRRLDSSRGRGAATYED